MKPIINIDCKKENKFMSLFKKTVISDTTLLHKALRFILEDDPDSAYEAIYHCLVKNGAKLTDEERELFDILRRRYR